ncbi:hypothetical protein L6452_44755 [Arctium lappa]|nr:hypothetical protein L6452_44755 [Arctium lappa]
MISDDLHLLSFGVCGSRTSNAGVAQFTVEGSGEEVLRGFGSSCAARVMQQWKGTPCSWKPQLRIAPQQIFTSDSGKGNGGLKYGHVEVLKKPLNYAKAMRTEEKRHNRHIHVVCDAMGVVANGDDVARVFINHFQSILVVHDENVDPIMPSDIFSKKLSTRESLHMIRPISDEEIHKVLWEGVNGEMVLFSVREAWKSLDGPKGCLAEICLV